MPAFNYNGEGAANTGLSVNDAGRALAQSWGINPAEFSGYRVDNGRVIGISRNATVTMDGVTRPAETDLGYTNDLRNNLSQGNGSQESGQVLVMNNGQMGYWDTHTTGGKNDHTTRVFRPVGPSEAQKAAIAAKALQDKQQAEAAAKDFSAKTAAAANEAEINRQQAVAAAAAAGQHQSVSSAQSALANATSEVQRLKSASDAALNTAKKTRQAAVNAIPAAAAAEKKYQDLLIATNGMVLKNGQYGIEKWEVVKSNKERDFYGNRFYPSGITKAQVDSAKADAESKRKQANTLPANATAAEQASLKATADYQAAETRRQAAQAALTSAQQAAAKAAEAERQRKAAEAAAASAAEQKRKAEEAAKAAELARKAAEQEKTRRARQEAANKLKSVNVQSVRGIPNAATPAAIPLAWATASYGGLSLGSDVVASVWSQITAGLAELRAIATASLAGPVAVTVASLLYSEKVGVGSDLVPGRDISSLMPADVLSLSGLSALNSAADSKTGVSMPVRGRMILGADGKLETQLVRTRVAGMVPVVRAVPDQATGYWGYTLPAVAGAPGQTILISPSDAPGVNGQLGLSGPVPLPENILHTGDQDIAPADTVVITTPVADDLDFSDVILIFPADSGLKPLYVMYRSPRNMPGTASGNGKGVGDNWLGKSVNGNGAPIPSQIADKLRGRKFDSFDSFRRALWSEVGKEPTLSSQFKGNNKKALSKGYSPFPPEAEQVGGRTRYELHHITPIKDGGAVYDVDNIGVLTPKRHIELHKNGE